MAKQLMYSWEPPVLNTDGSPVPADGPGSLVATRIAFGRASGEVGEILEQRWVGADEREAAFEASVPGMYFAAAYPINSYGRESVDTRFALREVA